MSPILEDSMDEDPKKPIASEQITQLDAPISPRSENSGIEIEQANGSQQKK